ncbi:MAG: patatin family protein [Lachnospiraceae bacterium]|nr:patatin family protein [Lachnospiraceae bacterium]
MSRREYDKMDKIPFGQANDHIQNACLVIEGGAFRGMYNQGVMDAWMKHGLNFGCVVGVSAGALAGMNYVSGQIGRSARANLGCRHDRNYIGTGAFRRAHSMINLDFLLQDYEDIEPFNTERFYSDLQRFVAVATNCETGETEYFEKNACDDIISAIKASASMPFISPMVKIGEGLYLDGGCSCKIAYKWALEQGFEKIVIIRTRDRKFRKKEKVKQTAKRFYRNYPAFAEKLDASNRDYNAQLDEIDELEKSGRVFVVAPEDPIHVSRVEGNMEKLGNLYWRGYHDGKECMMQIKEYLQA